MRVFGGFTLLVGVLALGACGGGGEALPPASSSASGSSAAVSPSGSASPAPSGSGSVSPAPSGSTSSSASASGSASPSGSGDSEQDAVGPPTQVGLDPALWEPVDLSGVPAAGRVLVMAGQRLTWSAPPTGLSSMFARSANPGVVSVEGGESGAPPMLTALVPGRALVSVWASAYDASFVEPATTVEVVAIARPRQGVSSAAPVDLSGLSVGSQVVMVPNQIALWVSLEEGPSYVAASLNPAVVETVSVLAGEGSERLLGFRAVAPGSGSVVLWDGDPKSGSAQIVAELVVTVQPPAPA